MQILTQLLTLPDGFNTSVTSTFKTTIVEDGSGREQRFINWQDPLLRFKISKDILLEDDRAYLVNFHNSVRGQEKGFLFRDGTDYKAESKGAEGVRSWGELHHIAGDNYQLVKVYQIAENCIHYRTITRPIADTVIIYDTNGEILTDWTIDETTGIITSTSDFSLLTSDFEFLVPVRFEQDEILYKLKTHEGKQTYQEEDFNLYSLEALNLVEVKENSYLNDIIPDRIEEQFLFDALLQGDTKLAYETEVINLESGYVDTNPRFTTPRRKGRLGQQIFRSYDELEYLIAWWRCSKGRGLTWVFEDEKEILHDNIRFDSDELAIKIEAKDESKIPGFKEPVLITSFDGIEITSAIECPPVVYRQDPPEDATATIFLGEGTNFFDTDSQGNGGNGGGNGSGSARYSTAFIVQAIEEKDQEIACISTPTWKRVFDGGIEKCLRVCDGTGNFTSLEECSGGSSSNTFEDVFNETVTLEPDSGGVIFGYGRRYTWTLAEDLNPHNKYRLEFTVSGSITTSIYRREMRGNSSTISTQEYTVETDFLGNRISSTGNPPNYPVGDYPSPSFLVQRLWNYNNLPNQSELLAWTGSISDFAFPASGLTTGAIEIEINPVNFGLNPPYPGYRAGSSFVFEIDNATEANYHLQNPPTYNSADSSLTLDNVRTYSGGYTINFKLQKVLTAEKLNKKAKVFYLATPQINQKITEIHETEPVLAYLSADSSEGIIGAIKKGKENSQWKKIQTIKYNTSNLDINSGAYTSSEWTNPNPPTTNQKDWRKTSSHSYLLVPPNDPNSCIQQRIGNTLTNVWDEDFSLTLGVSLNSLLFSDTLTQIVIDRLLFVNGSCSIANTVSKEIQIPKLINPQSAYSYLLSLSPDKLTVLASALFPI